MAKREYSTDELVAVLAGFGIVNVAKVERYGSGHINDTFKADGTDGVSYILQRINTDIFPDPDAMMENIERVTKHIRAKGGKSLEVLGYHNPWRLYAFITGARTVDLIENSSQAFLAANAFAKFQNDLADLPEPRLHEILPKFHNTLSRLELLDAAAKADVKGRLASVAQEMDFVNARREEAGRIVNAMATGEIPERITHNDTKINNVMLDDVTQEGVAVIDLDTTMPGSALYDFGDMVRTSTAAAAEDEKDLSKVFSRKEYFEALVKGYLKDAKFLNAAELDALAFSGRLITLTIGIRFLTDYLAGDTYFRTAYPDHNLVRCRTQLKMVKSMEDQRDEYEKIVRETAAASR
ncbi:MAG: aminoglycoside phosphotransferase family protein [Kiritimatiellae bacterium]|nr:aminoglycoside phosphotransferase family protein [Kiritimatiellia bacterium]